VWLTHAARGNGVARLEGRIRELLVGGAASDRIALCPIGFPERNV
jgi:hypothetical protein